MNPAIERLLRWRNGSFKWLVEHFSYLDVFEEVVPVCRRAFLSWILGAVGWLLIRRCSWSTERNGVHRRRFYIDGVQVSRCVVPADGIWHHVVVING